MVIATKIVNCLVCKHTRNNPFWECSHVDCPIRSLVTRDLNGQSEPIGNASGTFVCTKKYKEDE